MIIVINAKYRIIIELGTKTNATSIFRIYSAYCITYRYNAFLQPWACLRFCIVLFYLACIAQYPIVADHLTGSHLLVTIAFHEDTSDIIFPVKLLLCGIEEYVLFGLFGVALKSLNDS